MSLIHEEPLGAGKNGNVEHVCFAYMTKNGPQMFAAAGKGDREGAVVWGRGGVLFPFSDLTSSPFSFFLCVSRPSTPFYCCIVLSFTHLSVFHCLHFKGIYCLSLYYFFVGVICNAAVDSVFSVNY